MASRYTPRAKWFVIRVYYRRGRGSYYVKLVDKYNRRRVVKGLRGAERFERERDGLWVVITNRWHGNPVVLPGDTE